MTSEERDLITGLFNRLSTTDTQQHDTDADSLIRQSVAAQPGTPYQLVQTLLVQEHALLNAQTRIKALEQQVAAASTPQPAAHSGGFLSGLFGGGSSTPAPAPTNIATRSLPAAGPASVNPPYPSTVNLPPSAGGGFLRGALTTAAGVAGGALLFEGIEDLLGHRSGAFGSGMGGGGGGFMDTGFGGRPEVIENNYYGNAGSRDNDPQQTGPDPSFQNDSGLQNAGDLQDPNLGSQGDDFPASVDLNNDVPPTDALDDFGSSNDNDNVADSGSYDSSSDDSSSV